MKETVDKHLDDLTRKVIKEGSKESPSFNFTDSVMSQIEPLSSTSKIQYKPLISKTTWFLILIGFIALLIYTSLLGIKTNSSSWLNEINFNVLSNNKFADSLNNFKMSKIVIYTIILPFIKISFK